MTFDNEYRNVEGRPAGFPEDVLNRYLRPLRDSAYEVFKGHWSDSKSVISAMEYCRERVHKEVRVDRQIDGSFRDTAVTDDILRIGNVMGYSFNPKGTSPHNSWQGRKVTLFRKSVERMRMFIEATMPLEVNPSDLVINRFSSLGAPSYAKSVESKAEVIEPYLDRLGDVTKLYASLDLRALLNDYGLLFCYIAGERHQAQKILGDPRSGYSVKERSVYDINGNFVEVDSTLPQDVASFSPLARRCRSRVISVSTMAAFPLRLLGNSWANHMNSAYPYTFKHGSPDTYSMRVSRFEGHLAVDVSNHDQNIPPQFAHVLEDLCEFSLGPLWAMQLAMAIRQPHLSRSDYLGSKGVKIYGDPFDASTFTALPVNTSGNPVTTQISSLAGAFYVCDALMEAGEIPDTREGMLSFLRGENRHWGMINGGDNNLIGGPSANHIRELLDTLPYADLDTTESFMGWVLYKGADGGLKLLPNIPGYINNLLMPGRSLQDPMRGDPIKGAYARRAHYSAHPEFPVFDDILSSAVNKFFGIPYDELSEPDFGKVRAVNVTDYVYLTNPDSIHYKVDRDDLTAGLFDIFYYVVPASRSSAISEAMANTNLWPEARSSLLELKGSSAITPIYYVKG